MNNLEFQTYRVVGENIEVINPKRFGLWLLCSTAVSFLVKTEDDAELVKNGGVPDFMGYAEYAFGNISTLVNTEDSNTKNPVLRPTGTQVRKAIYAAEDAMGCHPAKRKIGDFDKEFWWFYLGFIVLNILAVMADDVITYLTGGFSGWARLVATLFLLLPMLSVTNRRLHDIGRSGSWQYLWFGPLLLLVLIFIIDSSIESETSDFIYGAIGVLIFSIAGGWVALLILMLFKTSPKINKWGAPAKRV